MYFRILQPPPSQKKKQAQKPLAFHVSKSVCYVHEEKQMDDLTIRQHPSVINLQQKKEALCDSS